MEKLTDWVAIVDDELAIRRVLMRVLRLEHVEAREFASGASFLATLDVDPPGCVMLDIVMPEMNGLEVLSRIRHRNPDLPVILMSGNVTPPALLSSDSGARVHFLQKPFHAATLLDALRTAMHVNTDQLKHDQVISAYGGR